MTAVQKIACALFAAAAAFMAATTFLLFEARRGVPFSFTVELALAALVAIVVPWLTVRALRQRFEMLRGALTGFVLFYGICALIAGVFALAMR